MSLEIVEHKNFHLIQLIDELDKSNFEDFEKFRAKIAASQFPLIINCHRLESMQQLWFRGFVTFIKSCKESSRMIVFIQLPKFFKDMITENALQDMFKLGKDLRDAKKMIGVLEHKSLDVNFINPFIKATMKVLKVQASTEVKATKPFMKSDPKEKMLGDISGMIGVVSNSFNGNIVVSFPEGTFLKIMTKMLGEEVKEMNKEIIDGAGELMNIIFGQAKIDLNEMGYAIKTAIPSVITGKNHSIMMNQSDALVVVLPFESDCGNFNLEICITD
jgi:chemotaxis protein CheX